MKWNFHKYLQLFLSHTGKFLAHKKACRRLIELKQKSLPRLSFLSDQESLILLGGLTGDGDTFQKVVRKILGQGMKTIIFEEVKFDRDDIKLEKTVGTIETENGETLQIYRHVDCRNPTDVWLSQLIDEMRKSVKNNMRRALKESTDINDYEYDDYGIFMCLTCWKQGFSTGFFQLVYFRGYLQGS